MTNSDSWSRAADEQNFAFLGKGHIESSCRIQILRSDDGDVLLVAVQELNREGTSLVNGAEAVMEAAWRAFAPDLPTPPPMHAHFTGIDHNDEDLTVVVKDEHGVFRAHWRKPSLDEWSAIQDHADLDRGLEWVAPRDPEPTHWSVWRNYPVADLPPSRLWKPDWVACAIPDPPKRRLFRKPPPAPTRDNPVGIENCCRFHAGSWQAASNWARQALLSGADHAEAQNHYGVEREANDWLAQKIDDPWLRNAAACLIDRPIVLSGPYQFVNGAHRSEAMRDQLVKMTIVCELTPIESDPDASWLLYVPHI